jgi:hypothetical protein
VARNLGVALPTDQTQSILTTLTTCVLLIYDGEELSNRFVV